MTSKAVGRCCWPCNSNNGSIRSSSPSAGTCPQRPTALQQAEGSSAGAGQSPPAERPPPQLSTRGGCLIPVPQRWGAHPDPKTGAWTGVCPVCSRTDLQTEFNTQLLHIFLFLRKITLGFMSRCWLVLLLQLSPHHTTPTLPMTSLNDDKPK